MTPLQLELRTIQIADQVLKKQPVEDTLIELKSEWPKETYEAARQLAGHANAARGEPIIWIIGLHDKSRQVTGADDQELSQWYAQMKSHHEAGRAPDMLMQRTVPYQGKTLVAMLFDTQSPPYLVKNPEFGRTKGVRISLEMPWREATAARSATREDILRLLAPLELLPECQVLDIVATHGRRHGSNLDFHLEITVYLIPRSERRVVIPVQQCEGELDFGEVTVELHVEHMRSATSLHSQEERRRRSLIFEEPNSLVVEGPGVALFYVSAARSIDGITARRADVLFSMRPAGASMPIKIAETLTRRTEHQRFTWDR